MGKIVCQFGKVHGRCRCIGGHDNKVIQCDDPSHKPEESLFIDAGGTYVAMIDGVDIAYFAPSQHWTDYVRMMERDPGFTYRFELREDWGD